jgi:hypothetical protein
MPGARRRPAGDRPPRRWWLAVAILGITVFVLLGRDWGDDEQALGEPAQTPALEPAPAEQAVEAGSLTAAGDDLFAADDLGAYTREEAIGTEVPVHSIVSETAFWVGPDDRRRVLVVVVDGDAADLEAGDIVTFTGTVRLPVEEEELRAAADRERLERQGAVIHVEQADMAAR